MAEGRGLEPRRAINPVDFKFDISECGIIKTTTYKKVVTIILPHSAPYTQPFAVICK